MKRFWIRRVAGIMLVAVAGIFLLGTLVMLLWNNLLPALFHAPVISFWQALGVLVLSKILFGGFRGGHWGRQHWKQKMEKKWQTMTPEEREKFQQEWKSRCGRGFTARFEKEEMNK